MIQGALVTRSEMDYQLANIRLTSIQYPYLRAALLIACFRSYVAYLS